MKSARNALMRQLRWRPVVAFGFVFGSVLLSIVQLSRDHIISDQLSHNTHPAWNRQLHEDANEAPLPRRETQQRDKLTNSSRTGGLVKRIRQNSTAESIAAREKLLSERKNIAVTPGGASTQSGSSSGAVEPLQPAAGGNATLDRERVSTTWTPASCTKRLEPTENIFLLMTSHSGSTALITELASHTQIGNFTDTSNLEPLVRFRRDPEGQRLRVREIFSKARVNGKIGLLKAGARSILQQPAEWQKLMQEEKPRLLFIHRDNHFKRAVGRYPFRYLAYDKHYGGLAPGQKSICGGSAQCKFEVGVEQLLCLMKRGRVLSEKIREKVKVLVEAVGCSHEILYEDYLYRHDETVDAALKFLGLEHEKLTAERSKALSDNMCNVITNYADVCAAFNECSYWGPLINDRVNNCTCDNFSYTSLGGDDVNPLCGTDKLEKESLWCVSS
mmetsp:Transcript_11807/g.36017  ORF Transcript_11807/g.36017 Transcript_11807/m.36017 type:complete len:445 (+) Transcript_11807:128-1462(+)